MRPFTTVQQGSHRWVTLAVACLVLAGVLSACDGDSNRRPLGASQSGLLDQYDLRAASCDDQPLTLAFATEGVGAQTVRQHVLELSHPDGAVDMLIGRVDLASGIFALEPGSSLAFRDVGSDALVGDFQVALLQPWILSRSDRPAAGSMAVVQGANVVHLEVDPDQTGVIMSLDADGNGVPDDGPVRLTWTQFENLSRAAAALPWQRLAWAGYASAIELMLEPLALAAQALQQIENDMVQVSPRPARCNSFRDSIWRSSCSLV